ncbi:MAG: Tyrosine--tRNA ligase [bacterium ADurb.Bin429]|nr:MAG: Tyrosine--tRNA ligase [bacterium ADurb.Bin429]
MSKLTIAEQIAAMRRGVVDLISPAELEAKLKLGRPLRVKFGADPSAPDLHLGHCVQLRALRRMQELGHQVVFIVGDFTAMIGDPSGRSATRPQLTRKQVEENAATYVAQADRILDISKLEIRFNSEFLGTLTSEDMIRLAGKFTVAQMLEREDFTKRFSEQSPIGLHELFYPLMQGYDSYAIEADIEFGGTDQTFNLLVGREMQRLHGMTEQVVMTRPLIPGTDGEKKMSKSLGNYIAVLDSPEEMFGKLMSLPDKLIPMYFEYLTDVPMAEIDALVAAMGAGELNPRDAKDQLAQAIITELHGAEAGREASASFRRTFSGRGQTLDDFRAVAEPAALPATVFSEEVPLAKLMHDIGMTASSGEARRLIEGGAVFIDEDKVTDPKAIITPREGAVLRAGKRRVAVLVKV